MKRLLLFLVLFSLPLVFAVIPADESLPQVVHKPIIVTPGEPVMVAIYNGGHEVWTDLFVSVADGPLEPVAMLLEPEGFVSVPLTVPLAFLLSTKELEVSVWHAGKMIDARLLPIVVDYPEQLAFVDVNGPGGPEFIILVDPAGRSLGGVQVEVALEQDGVVSYFDFFGPFSMGEGVLVYRSPVPEAYVASGSYDVRATFYAGDAVFAETNVPVSFKGQGPSFAPLVIVLLTVLFIMLLYMIIDMTYYRRTFKESWRELR